MLACFKRKLSYYRNRRLIEANQSARILVCLHMYYWDKLPVIAEYLKNLECYCYDLIVTYSGTGDANGIARLKRIKADVTLLACPNNGFDIGPFCEVLRQVDLSQYDIVMKLQTKGKKKRILTNGQFFKRNDWFIYLYEGVLNAFRVHKNIELLLADNAVGIVAAENLIVHDPVHKQRFTERQLEKHGLHLPENYRFVGGTCYAARAKLLKPIQELGFTIDDFEESETGYFSFAHAMERYLTASLPDGYTLYGSNVCRFRKWVRGIEAIPYKRWSGLRLCEDDRIVLSDDFVLRWLEHRLVLKYEVIKLPAKDIRRMDASGEPIPLIECEPYRYFLGEVEGYVRYCKTRRRTDDMSLSQKEYEKAAEDCEEQYEALIRKLDQESYDPKQVIAVDRRNMVYDGQHRACYLLYKYGGDYEVPVLRIYETLGNEIKSYVKHLLWKRLDQDAFERVVQRYRAVR